MWRGLRSHRITQFLLLALVVTALCAAALTTLLGLYASGARHISPGVMAMLAVTSALRGLLKTQFEEIKADGRAERIKKRAERSPVISEKDLPCLEVRNCALDGSADRADLVIVLVLTHV